MNKYLSTFLLTSAAITFVLNAAEAKEITFVSQGGAYQEAQTKAILDPVSKLTGITINQDSSPEAYAIIKTQIESGKPTWDVVDAPTADCIKAGSENMVEKLDFSKLPNTDALPAAYKTPHSVAYEFFSSVLAYNKKKFGDKPPQTWADFWDVKKFPGTRALRNHPTGTLEAALLADGVPKDKLYPLDLDRAFKKLEEIKPHIAVWWTSGAQSAQLLADGEVDMEMAWNGRVSSVAKEGAPVGYTYNDGLLQFTSLCILKGSPNAATAVEFVNAALKADIQANFPTYIDYGPANPEAYSTGKISAERSAEMPSSPENTAKQAILSDEYWGSKQGDEALKRWARFIQQ
jgi:putative spermidine/putrescine transport system substrate-binding protein